MVLHIFMILKVFVSSSCMFDNLGAFQISKFEDLYCSSFLRNPKNERGLLAPDAAVLVRSGFCDISISWETVGKVPL